VAGVLEAESAASIPEPRRIASGRVWRRLARQPVTLVAGFILTAIFVAGALVPQYTPPVAHIHLSQRWLNHPPMLSGWHVLGTDAIGRDMLIRTLYGLHTSEQSALAATLFATVIGVLLGGIAGYRGGWLDAFIMRITDLLGVFPALMLLLAVYTWWFPVTAWRASVLFALYLWVPMARVVRAEIASLREREFVQAALSLGANDRRIFFRHLFPNGSGTIIIAATSLLGLVFVLEATVEFFGLGVPSDLYPTLGNLIGDGQRNAFALGQGWWTWAGPAALLMVILVCVNLLGDGLADALRPARMRR
jgi:ABC-type dipeptide/oligopeptide/nickel transport system permease subunit